MEFNYRAINKKSTTTSSPLSSITTVSERILPGAREASGMLNAFRAPVGMWRELEKEKIRREIITGEIVWRKELEEEVRREMFMERQLGFPMQRCLVEPFLFQDQLASWSNPIKKPLPVNDVIDMSQHELPKTVANVEIESSPKIDKEKVIMLPKPNRDLHSAKRKAVEIATNDKEASTLGMKKKSNEENWRCSICQVSTTSEIALKQHMQGKKHKKVKEKAKRTHMIGNNTKTSLSLEKNENCVKDVETILFPTIFPGLDARTLMKFPQPSITKVEPRVLEEGELVEEEEEEVEEGEIISGAANKWKRN